MGKNAHEINVATKALQNKTATLSDSWYILDSLIEAVQAGKDNDESDLYGCILGTKYISLHSSISSNSRCESGVIKIQRNAVSEISEEEIKACSNLRIVSNLPTNSCVSS